MPGIRRDKLIENVGGDIKRRDHNNAEIIKKHRGESSWLINEEVD
jgi:hypothetical protein